MLAFRGSRFQYFLSVSPPEGLGRDDLSRWILEARKRQIHVGLTLDQMLMFRASGPSRKACDGPEKRPLPERCLVMQGSGPPILPTAYNNNTQIVQGPGYVAILVEMGHETRVIPLDDRPHLPKDVRQWKGDSRGHWEGDTLVVETTNFTNKSAFRGTSENMRLIERFRRMDANTLLYQFTVEDPATFAKPWTVEIPVPKSEGRIFEYACHEGNYGMFGALAGARAEEKKAAANGNKSSK